MCSNSSTIPSLVKLSQDRLLAVLEECKYDARLIRDVCRYVPDNLLEPMFERLIETGKITDVPLMLYFAPGRYQIKITHAINIRNSTFKLIGLNCPNLIKLNLADCIQVSNTVVRAILQGCSMLEEIYLDRCHRITDTAFDFSSSPFQSFVGCLALEVISLQGCPQITGEVIPTLNKNCRNLCYLNLSQCKNVKSPKIQDIFEHNHLKSLNLSFIDDISDEIFQKLPRFINSPKISEFNLSSLRALSLCKSKITDESITHMATMRGLTEIRLQWCTGITDRGILTLVKLCPKLRIIDLKSCIITDASLDAIGAVCQELRELDLSWCFNVTNIGLQKLIPMNELETLSLVWCPQLTDETLDILGTFPSLRKIKLNGCSGLTTTNLEKFSSSGVEVII